MICDYGNETTINSSNNGNNANNIDNNRTDFCICDDLMIIGWIFYPIKLRTIRIVAVVVLIVT